MVQFAVQETLVSALGTFKIPSFLKNVYNLKCYMLCTINILFVLFMQENGISVVLEKLTVVFFVPEGMVHELSLPI